MAEVERVEALVNENIRLVGYAMKTIGLHWQIDEEAYSYGLEGLWNAARTFDETQNIKFSSYAVRCILNNIYNCLNKEKRDRIKRSTTVSLDTTIKSPAYTSHHEDTFVDLLEGGEDPADIFSKAEIAEELRDALMLAYFDLPEGRRKDVVTIWLQTIIGEDLSDTAIAKELGCSSTHVRHSLRIYFKAVREYVDKEWIEYYVKRNNITIF